MPRLAAILALVTLLALPAPAAGGQNPQQPPPTLPAHQQPSKGAIRVYADLVLIDVQVTDRSGKPVKGLRREQFTVLEDDKPQTISSFDYFDIEGLETAAAESTAPVVLALGAAAPAEQVREAVRDHRLLVLFFDQSSLQPDELLRSTGAALRFLREQMTPSDLVAVVAFGNQLRVLANFTGDRDLLSQAIAKLVPGKESQLAAMADAAAANGEDTVTEDTGAAFTADETEFNVFNTDRKLAAVQALADLLRNIPGKKAIVHFTGGITQTGDENRSQLRAAADAANRANVSIYAVDSRGLLAAIPGGDASVGAATGTSMFSGSAVFQQAQSRQDSRDTLATLASDTGGRAFFDVGDFREVFEKVRADTAGYYLVGYYSTNTRRDGRWRSVKVRLSAPGVTGLPSPERSGGVPGAATGSAQAGLRIRYREGYYAPRDSSVSTSEDRERQLEDAMRAETPRVELPLALETAHFRLSQNEVFVTIAAKLASSALEWAQKRGRREAEFDFAAEARDTRSGRVVGALRDTVKVRLDAERFQQVLQRALVYQGGLVLGPGNYRLKFLARENETGRIGTFEQDLTLPRPQLDRLELSSVLLSSQVETPRQDRAVEKKAFAAEAKLKASPLEVGGQRIVPSVTRVFTPTQKLYVLFQAYLPSQPAPHHDGTGPAGAGQLRAGLVFFRNGLEASRTPLSPLSEFNEKTQTAAFRIALPLEKFAPGRYTLQVVVVEAGSEQAAFARNFFALRPAPAPTPAPAPIP